MWLPQQTYHTVEEIFVSCSYKTRNMSAKLVLRYIALNVAYHKKWWFFWNWAFDVFQCGTYSSYDITKDKAENEIN